MIDAIKFRAYTQCQHSGVTNMVDIKAVSLITDLTREECLDIMKNYIEYKNKYGDDEI